MAITTASEAERAAREAWTRYREVSNAYQQALDHHGNLGRIDNPAQALVDTQQAVTAAQAAAQAAEQRVAALRREPVLRSQPAGWLETERSTWHADRDIAELRRYAELAARASRHDANPAGRQLGQGRDEAYRPATPDHGRGISR